METRVVSGLRYSVPYECADSNNYIIAIQAPVDIPAPHPHDRALLRPLSTLGKPKFADASISFLRRTEYISSHTSKSRFESTTSKSLISNTGTRTRKVASTLDKESPSAIKAAIEDSFKIAANSLKNKHAIQHPNPNKRNLKVLEAYPLLPDDKASTDAGGFCEVKFFTNPVPPSLSYDARLEVALLKPLEQTEAEEALKNALQEAHDLDPHRNPAPENVLNYDYFLPSSTSDVKSIKRKFNVLDPDRDSASLYTTKNADGEGCFRYKKIRAYESTKPPSSNQEDKYDIVVLALHDGTDGEHQRAAHYYPLVQKIVIKPQRNKHIEMRRQRLDVGEQEGEGGMDYIELGVVDPDEATEAMRSEWREYPFGKPVEPDEEGEGEGEAEAENDDNRVTAEVVVGSSQGIEEDADADGDEE